jgi:ABC-type transporter Mla MlaB component
LRDAEKGRGEMKKRGRPTRGRRRSGGRSGAKSDRTLRLDAQCTIAQASAVKARLARLLGHPGKVAVDGGAVERIDTACLQLLAAFVRERRAADRPVAWSNASAELIDNARLLGLSAVLETQSLGLS